MMNSINQFYKILALFIVVCVTISACDVENTNIGNIYPNPSDESPLPTSVFIQESAVVYHTYKDIVEKSEIIIIGVPVKYCIIRRS